MVWFSYECCQPWDNSACFQHEGDVLCLSVMSHLNKCTSRGGADLAFSPSIHHINAIAQKCQICIADSAAGPKVYDIYVRVWLLACVYVCVRAIAQRRIKKRNKWTNCEAGLLGSSKDLKDFFQLFTYAKNLVNPPRSQLSSRKKPIKTLLFNVYLN